MIKLFIGGFPLEMDEIRLVQLVDPYANVLTIKLVKNKQTKVCKGYGFIEVADETQALNAVANLDGTKVGDRILSVSIAPEKPASKPSGFRRAAPRPGHTRR